VKKFLLLVLVLFAVETYGVVGASLTLGLVRTCSLRVGPLCYAWEDSRLTKLIGAERVAAMENTILGARDQFQEQLLDLAGKKEKISGAMDLVGEQLKKAFESLAK
jgi:hypothetical protein